MANKKISELESRASLSLSDLMAVGDPSTGYLYKTTISDLKTLTGAGVVSFNGRFGTVNPAEGDYTLTQLGDVIITSPSNGQVLKYNGSNWVNASDVTEADTLDTVTTRGNTTANSITVGSVTAAGLSNLLGQIKTFVTTGNTYIGANPTSATDAGFKLDVNGTTRLNGATSVTGVLTGSDTIRSTNGTVTVSISYGSTAGIIGTTSNHSLELRTNNTYRIGVSTAGVVNVSNLAGTGSRIVVADAAGNLSASSALTGYVTLDTFQTITASKTFSVGFSLASAGGANQLTSFANANSIHSGSADTNVFGFNSSNNIYFGKGLSNGGVIAWNNSVVRSYTLPNADGTIALTSDIPSVAGVYLPLAGGTLTGALGGTSAAFTSSGSGDTFAITHSSGSGIALNITKGGNGEGLYINKTSGTGNAATIIGTLNATTLVKSGGTSGQFLKADGSVDSSTYLTSASVSGVYLPLSGGTLTGALNGTSASFSGQVEGSIINSTSNAFRFSGNNALSLVSLGGQNVVKINAAGYWGTQLVGANDQGILVNNIGNVGIGLTNPTDLLTLQRNDGRLRFNTSAGTRVLLIGDDFGSGGFQQIYDAAGSIKVQFSATTSYFNGGNVGINTAAPDSKFHVGSSNGSQIRFDFAGSGDNYYDAVTHYFRNGNGASNVMTLLNSGNVGINTTNPVSRLHVSGGGLFTGGDYTDASLVNAMKIGYNTASNYGYLESVQVDSTVRPLRVNQYGGATSFGGIVGVGTHTPSAFGSQRFLAVGTAGGQVARFTDGANADIVFDNPTPGVTRITAQYGTTGALQFAKGTGFDPTMIIAGNGNVGINTTSFQGKFNVTGASGIPVDDSAYTGYLVSKFENSQQAYVEIRNTVGTQAGLLLKGTGLTSSQHFLVGLNNESKLRIGYGTGITDSKDGSNGITIQPNGNVGIANANPSYTFDVNKSVDANFVARISNSSSTGFGLYVQANDNTKAGIRIANASGATTIDLFGSGAATFTGDVKVKTLEVTNVGTDATSSGVSTYMQITVNGNPYLIPLHGTP